jgi:hypothetical protein
MGYIKEPKGVDFIIKSEPLTDDERAAISEFIRQYKSKHENKKDTKTRVIPSQRKARATNKSIAASGR